jgi:CDP-diacylglycerol--glycerol-3-phosphate 3-phosphatidyltransferase
MKSRFWIGSGDHRAEWLRKHIPNAVTCLRILGSAVLLFLKPLSAPFFAVYVFCGATDALDGFLARKTGAVSKKGAMLDSTSDMVFIAAAFWCFLPVLFSMAWILGWIAGILLIRFFSLAVGYIRFRTLACLHTYANKAAGFLLFCFPFLYRLFGPAAAAYPVLAAAYLSAVEEAAVNLTSASLRRDVKSIFTKK